MFERAPLHVPRGVQGHFDDLLSRATVEAMVASGGLRHPGFRLVKAHTTLRLSDYARDIPWRPEPFTGTIDVLRAAREFDAGASIVLQGLHHTHPPLGTFCRLLEADLGHPVQANAYLTPRGSQGLPVHHDTHDVFCLQVAGEKRWLVYDPVLELPLRDQRYRPELGEPGEPVLDIVLRAGDTLYLPRGWLHEALTSESDSLHLTIGVNVYTWLDALRAAVEECAADVEFRRSVPEDGATDADLLERLDARLDPERVARRMRSKLVRTRRPVAPDALAALRDLDTLTADAPVQRRPTVLWEHDRGGLVFEGKRLAVPAHAQAALRAAAEAAGPFTAADLPGDDLDEAGRVVLVRVLVREGFLRRTAAGA